jgi:exosortase A-associated hydrolase 1
MNFVERALKFRCHDCWLYGILSLPEHAFSRGVLIVVGGPQYRAGSHRQFTLLARHLASHGVPALRFDYRGMGDSEGGMRTFEDIQDDLRCAIDCLFKEAPCLKDVVIWGLCDAASAASFYASHDTRVSGLVLLNPWVRTQEGTAKAYLRHYYAARLFNPELWKKICQGRFDYGQAVRSLLKMAGAALPGKKKAAPLAREVSRTGSSESVSLPDRVFEGLSRFKGKILLIMSGDDLTAKEFSDLASSSRRWRRLMRSTRIKRLDLMEANHTFSRGAWRDRVAVWTRDWIKSW